MDTSAVQHMEVKKQTSPFSSLFSMTSSPANCNVKRSCQELGWADFDLVESQIIKPGNRSEVKSPFGMEGSKKLKTEGNCEIVVLPAREATPSSPRSLKSSQNSEEQQAEFQEPSTVDKSNYAVVVLYHPNLSLIFKKNECEGILSSSHLVNFSQPEKSTASAASNLPAGKSTTVSASGFSLPEKLSQKLDFSTQSKLKRWFKIMDKANVSSEVVEQYLQSKAIKSEKSHVKAFTQAHQRALFHLEKILFDPETSRVPRDISKESNLASYIESQVKGPKLSLKQYVDI